MGKCQFYWRWFVLAFRHSIGIADSASAVIIALVLLFGKFFRVEALVSIDWWWLILVILGIVFLVRLLLAPYWIYKEKVEEINRLSSLLNTGSESKVAQPQLNFDKVIYRFEKASNGIQVVAELIMSATGIMQVEDINLVISGKSITCERWIVREVGMGYTLPTVRFMVGNKLTVGEHEVRLKAYANRQWWASRPSAINYDPSILDKEGS